MKPKSYWQKRSEQIGARQFKKADAYERELMREYERAQRTIRRDIEAFYGRFADNNEVSFEEAQKLLNAGELAEFKMTLAEFREKAKDNADGRWTRELDNVYYKTRVSRLEALEVQVNHQIEMLAVSKQTGIQNLLGDAYTDTYYRTMHEIQTGTGIGSSFARIDGKGIEKVLATNLDGRNWSERIWDDRTKLRQELHTRLSQGFIRGDSVDRMSISLAERMGVSYNRAKTLIQTETAFFTEQATMDSYEESGVVDRYEVLVTLDERTCPICGALDGKVFKLGEMDVGVNYPPFHARCRCTTVPYFDDEFDVGERIARDADGQVYYVSSDMSYEEWNKQHTDSPLGLAARDENGDNNSESLQFVQKLKPEEVSEAVHTYERSIRRADVEHAYVIRPDGEVYYKQGTTANVGFSDEELRQMKDAVVTHNHPADVTQWSFSREDVQLYVETGMKELRATDEKYAYSISGRPNASSAEIHQLFRESRLEAIFEMQKENVPIDQIDELLEHETIQLLSKKLGLSYRRWSVE